MSAEQEQKLAGEGLAREALNKLIRPMPVDFLIGRFDKPVLSSPKGLS